MKKNEQKQEGRGLSRRNFLTGGVALGAAAAASVALSGCNGKPRADAAPVNPNDSNPALADPPTVGPQRKATADLHNAAPIAPVAPPASWDEEADIVIVGAGGGGIAGALLAAENKAKVIVVEKESSAGGATQHANGWLNVSGTGKAQQKMKFSWPKGNVPFKRKPFVAAAQELYQFSINNDLIANMGEKGGEVADWMTAHGADWICAGPFYIPKGGLVQSILGQKQLTDQFSKLGQKAGAEYKFNTACQALVKDGDRVVGVKVTDPDGHDAYYHAKKGVILTAGGFGMNPDMLKKYIPSAYESIVYGGPFPSHTGEVTRMAIGCGADMSGLDSWSCWESAPDDGTGQWHYFYGFRQFVQMPWLNFDREGNRCDFYDARLKDAPQCLGGLGDTMRASVQMSRPGHRAYVIFDSNYEKYMKKIRDKMGERRGHYKNDPVNYPNNLVNMDWHVDFNNALNDGRLKKADTLDELAGKLGLDPKVVNDVVKRWNKSCDKGVDDDPYLIYHYLPEWMNPIRKGPFYGAALGGCLGKTMAGVRVDKDLHVMDTTGHQIPGLYAGYTTAGGIVGEENYGGGMVNTSILGGCALSWTSGYTATQTALADNA